MKTKRIRQGFSEYLVIEKENSNDYDEKVICSNQIDALLPCEIRNEEGKECFYYQLSSVHCLEDEMKNLKFTDFCVLLIQAMEELENYLLDLDHVILKPDHIFVNDKKPKLCYSLEYKENIKSQWIEFVETAVDMIAYGDKEDVTKTYGFHIFLKDENPSLIQMKEYLVPMPSVEIPKIELEEEIEPWVEEVFSPPEKEKSKLPWLIPCIAFVPMLGLFSYMIIKIMLQGWLYENVRNAVVLFFAICIDVTCFLSAKMKKGAENSTEEEKKFEVDNYEQETILLSQETTLLSETKYPRLIPENSMYDEIVVDKNKFLFGSAKEQVDFQVAQIGVSRVHMKIEHGEEGYEIVDLNSKNGTYVNDERVAGSGKILKSEDIIRIGLEEFRFVI
ncbi:MAG: DUF6382 domain-containing protein [Anaerostipes sp.]